MFGMGKGKKSNEETVIYEGEAYGPPPEHRDAALWVGLGGHMPDAAMELAGRIPGAAKSLADRTAGTVRPLAERLPDRGRARDSAKSLADKLPDRSTAYSLIDRLPDPLRDAANERLGRKKRRSLWKTVAVVAVVGAGAAGAYVLVKRFVFPSYEEYPLYDGGPDDRGGDAGEPHAYPATGSGTGWPEPQRTMDNVETLPGEPVLPLGMNGGRSESRTSMSAGTPGDERSEPFIVESQATGRHDETLANAPTQEFSRPSGIDTAPAGSFYALDSRGGDAVPAEPSKPSMRPEVPLNEDQAEMNARLQLKQNELYAAFPGMTRQDIVACDGYLSRLVEILTPRSGMSAEEVRTRLDHILGTGPKDATNPVLPDADR